MVRIGGPGMRFALEQIPRLQRFAQALCGKGLVEAGFSPHDGGVGERRGAAHRDFAVGHRELDGRHDRFRRAAGILVHTPECGAGAVVVADKELGGDANLVQDVGLAVAGLGDV